jgi:hypothetical protein
VLQQRQNASKVALIMLAAGDELLEPLARALAPPPATNPTGSPIGLFTPLSRRAGSSDDVPGAAPATASSLRRRL